MHILLCGANGLIGRAIYTQLVQAGHQVYRGVRYPRHAQDVGIDFYQDTDPARWISRLHEMDVVINAVGILVEPWSKRGSAFETIHHRAPVALFHACAQAGVPHVIQISALGADTGDTPYFTSKRSADTYLQSLPMKWHILRPSLVYAPDGPASQMFRVLAACPVIPIPTWKGPQHFQPVHVDDVAAAVVAALSPDTPRNQIIPLVGSSRLTYAEMIRHYGHAMGIRPGMVIPLPAWYMSLIAQVGRWIPGMVFNPDTWRMLQMGSIGEIEGITRLLGRPPRGVHDFITPEARDGLRDQAIRGWQWPLLRGGMAVLWGLTGIGGWLMGGPLLGSGMAIAHGILGMASWLYPTAWLWALQCAIAGIYGLGMAIWWIGSGAPAAWIGICLSLAVIGVGLILHTQARYHQ